MTKKRYKMKELSIFIDESGDFGEYDFRSPYYIITMVFHNQEISIEKELSKLEKDLSSIGFPKHTVHAGPIVRGEYEYRNYDRDTRIKILSRMMSFINKANIKLQTFYVFKKEISDNIALTGRLSKKIADFIKNHYDSFLRFDVVKIYYDNGQIEITKILSSVFNSLLSNVEFRKVMPSDYRLFQVADIICTIKLTDLKAQDKRLSRSEREFFDNERSFKKNYLKQILKKQLDTK